MLRSSRRSSLFGSQHSLSSRRSSVNLKDIERIQIAAAQKRRNVSPHLLIFVLCGAPVFLFVHIYAVDECNASFIQLVRTIWSKSDVLSRIFPSPLSSVSWKIIVFTVLLQLIFCLILPGDIVTVINSMG
ncbi:unnamed protein product [Gongylonema pulchrum]|uniref:Pecanex-like protein n=1 Tax=Gongylonema pulchrum TaxID=637853 RepID=A0A183DY73_9BILA|nr:unnamed protein product [Gongylonema pulchrum]